MRVGKIFEFLEKIAARGGIVVFFIMAFEVLIMISPFAFFFYSVFNPILHGLQDYTATRWLTGFFLPHMILPPTLFLKALRVLGSILFVLGSATFLVCAFQVYPGKIFGWGIASRGLYCIIRHPQYLALGLWGMGMSILWPRFLVLASLSVMFALYYYLARDEERRMLGRFGEGYREYMNRTGMFLPRSLEARLRTPFRLLPVSWVRSAAIMLCIPIVVIGTGFLLRALTLNSLPLESRHNLTLVPILPEDAGLSGNILNEVFAGTGLPASLSFIRPEKDYLGYVMPPDYVMQGMIADTGGAFHLHSQHQSLALIADWIFNPFEHLRRSPSAQMAAMHHADPAVARRHHCPVMIDDPGMDCRTCPLRRIVLVEIDHEGNGHLSEAGLFSFSAKRVPVCFLDIDTSTGAIIDAKRVGSATAWMDVPTPAI